ncbi:hypothetical protein BV22DRAFT_473031 [Leucogyrophana mollusca]|uniref:Uncharacterized protein n=1 Tax=Leucogyrophana mollusca TaxID=85980 RepID=A0ACB8BGI7_9AGAM|nr:hypothetical protein BV22DRAFT_473031 [Leucogyrophana mollusca]
MKINSDRYTPAGSPPSRIAFLAPYIYFKATVRAIRAREQHLHLYPAALHLELEYLPRTTSNRRISAGWTIKGEKLKCTTDYRRLSLLAQVLTSPVLVSGASALTQCRIITDDFGLVSQFAEGGSVATIGAVLVESFSRRCRY